MIRYLVLLCACGAVAAFMYGRLADNLRPIEESDILSEDGKGTASAAAEFTPVTEFEVPALGRFSEAFERPLFRPDRRPVPADAPSNEAAPERTLDATLVGVLFSNAERVALLAPEDGSDPVRVLEEEEYRGWRLVEIRPASAIFTRNDESIELRLVYKGQNLMVEPTEKRR